MEFSVMSDLSTRILSAKRHVFLRDIREDKNVASAWTPYNESIQRRLFKGLREGSEPVAD
jgi:hypothetical protein